MAVVRAFLLAMFAAGIACAAGPARGADRPAPSSPNVLMVLVDTLGAGHTGFLEPGIGTTPSLDRLAARSVVFTHAYSTSSWTEPAVASLFTGVMPNRHGVVHLADALGPTLPVFAERLRAGGWKTAGVISHGLLAKKYGFARGFDSWDESPVGGHEAVTSEMVTSAALGWLQQNAGSRFFLLVHYFDPHYVYNHHPDFDRTSSYRGPLKSGMGIWGLLDYRPKMKRDDVRYLVGLYREEIAYTDHQIGRLFDGLAAMKHDSDTLVVFLADHGEEFMEHGWISHTKNLYDDVLHVPLTISSPGRLGHRVVDTPVSLLDVGPTLLDLLGLVPGSGDGISLAPLANGRPRAASERPLFAEVSYGKKTSDADKFFEKLSYKTSLRRGRWKLIHDILRSKWELYDTAADPSEKKNLVDEKSSRGRELAHELTDWERRRSTTATNPVVQPPPEEIERMRSLGYLR